MLAQVEEIPVPSRPPSWDFDGLGLVRLWAIYMCYVLCRLCDEDPRLSTRKVEGLVIIHT